MAAINLSIRGHMSRPMDGAEVELGRLGRGTRGQIVRICPAPGSECGPLGADELERRLLEIGFVEGARFEVLHEGPLGRDPIAVRIDDTRIAVRRRDAMAVMVKPDE